MQDGIDCPLLCEKVVGIITSQILEGKIKAGEIGNQSPPTQYVGLSRTPIREALRLLENDGFVEIKPRKGAFVTVITEKDVDDIFTLKLKLEPLGAKLSIFNMGNENIKSLREVNKKIMNYGKVKNISKMVQCNTLFHDAILKKCDNTRLLKFLDSLFAQSNRATAVSFHEASRVKDVAIEHSRIVDALENKDEKGVEKAMEQHIVNGWKFIRNSKGGFNRNGPIFNYII